MDLYDLSLVLTTAVRNALLHRQRVGLFQACRLERRLTKKAGESTAARFVTVDRDTERLLPPDMREWVPENHLSHFIFMTLLTGLLILSLRC
jgi:hypothetical protein